MISKLKHIIECTINKMDKAAALHQLENKVLDGNPPKTSRDEIGHQILDIQTLLINLSKHLK